MKCVSTLACLIVSILWSLAGIGAPPTGSAVSSQQPDLSVVNQRVNADLDTMARELAILVRSPGLRGFIRSEIAKSKNREHILELDDFLALASKNRDTSPGLAKFQEFSRGAGQRMRSGGVTLAGYDLYIPVAAHRAKWRGGDDFVVAYAPVGDDKTIQRIPSYSVRTGEQIFLDAKTPPETVVLMIAPEEHDNHEPDTQAPSGGKQPAYRGPTQPQVMGKETQDNPVDQSEGNSFVGVRWMWIRQLDEPWWLGDPELIGFFSQKRGNQCLTWRWEPVNYTNALFRSATDEIHARDFVDTWSLSTSSISCQLNPEIYRTTQNRSPCFYFDDTYWPKMRFDIYEEDRPLLPDRRYRSRVFELYHNLNCSFVVHQDDDYVDHATTYKSNFNFGVDYRQDAGNAYLIWHKLH